MKISNPLLNEQKRLRRNSFVLLLVLAFAMALLDYLVALSERLDLRQAQLNAATADFDHQLLPLLHLATVFQHEAGQLLQKPATAVPQLIAQQMALKVTEQDNNAKPLSADEISMLNQLEPWFRQQLKTSRYLLNISYISEGQQWVHFTDADARSVELATIAAKQINAMAHLQLNSTSANMLVLDELKQRYALHIPVRQDKNLVGHLLLEVDLLSMLQQVKMTQHGAMLMLMDKVGKVLLATQDGQLADSSSYNGSDQNDSLQHLEALPFALHIQPDSAADTKAELLRFATEVALYLVPMWLLYLYMLTRFKRKVLRPFARLLIHIARLERGDVQGVRHVPVEWDSVFKQAEQLRDRGLEKSAD
ncbi:hypothetical protein [Rheinheimera texasensis]|jgi:hypothetical protein|uniref:hypothetical protein n=1 Tax=Rheinheimera texasensis TaxID=306205 RepID=UPI0004E10AE8|nr:hypothetical protein [Rheinheimera texasensis]